MADSKKSNDDKKRTTQKWIVQGYVVDRSRHQFAPPTDIIELDDRLLIMIEIAGMKNDAFTIVLRNRQLVISGQRQQTSLNNPIFHQAEISYGAFRIEIALPWSSDPNKVRANYHNGFLQIELLRQPPRNIPINTGS
ncbi:MAG: Hsp20/alpha crystallin family protein [Chloroflexi bacterium]|nr:MAG: Hsp20/alpha crystallin family protein [Chloroflexota bacterium]